MTTPVSRARGHILTAQLSLIELVAWGVLYYAFAVFLPDMQAELGWSIAKLSLGFSTALVVSGLAAPAVGSWIDRRGSRGLMALGASSGSLGVGLWAIADAFHVYLAAWVLIGVGMAGTLYTPAFATVVRSMPNKDRSRGSILVITVVGALASTLFLPLGGALGEGVGWRAAIGVLAGVLAAVTIPLTATLPSPSQPPTETPACEPSAKAPPTGFRIVVIAMMIGSVATVAFNTHLVVFLVDRGHPLQVAAGIAGLGGVAKVGGRVATAAGGRFSAMSLMRGSFFLNGAAIALPLVWPTSTAAAIAMVLVVGATSGARTILRPALVVETFGVRSFGKKDGTLHLFTTFAKAAGPVGLGVLLGVAGESWSWASLGVLIAASGTLMFWIRPAVSEPLREDSTARAPGFRT